MSYKNDQHNLRRLLLKKDFEKDSVSQGLGIILPVVDEEYITFVNTTHDMPMPKMTKQVKNFAIPRQHVSIPFLQFSEYVGPE